LENPRKSWIFGHFRFAEAYRKALGCGGDSCAAKRDFPGSDLEITSFGAMPGGTNVTVTWDSVLSRWYYLQERLDLNPSSPWFDSGLGLIAPAGASIRRTSQHLPDHPGDHRFILHHQ